jgi:hypothetical protein
VTSDACPACGKQVLVAVSERGTRVPLDPEPSMTGLYLVTETGGEPSCFLARLPYPVPLFQPHLISCIPPKPTRTRRTA